ncbi:hypothetical protein A9174_10970 [Mesorhizobium loti NZP2037]|nr:hypothetical protein A9174_10970 [Mesorhizobium loti NZP2037]
MAPRRFGGVWPESCVTAVMPAAEPTDIDLSWVALVNLRSSKGKQKLSGAFLTAIRPVEPHET